MNCTQIATNTHFSTEVEFLGKMVNQERISVRRNRKEIIEFHPKPKTLTNHR